MYCKYCGQKIDDDSTFCTGCGAKITIAVKPVQKQQASAGTKPKHKIIRDDIAKEEYFEPSLNNIMAQFSPFSRFVFVLLCILMVLWISTLTIYTFSPEAISFFTSLQ